MAEVKRVLSRNNEIHELEMMLCYVMMLCVD